MYCGYFKVKASDLPIQDSGLTHPDLQGSKTLCALSELSIPQNFRAEQTLNNYQFKRASLSRPNKCDE